MHVKKDSLLTSKELTSRSGIFSTSVIVSVVPYILTLFSSTTKVTTLFSTLEWVNEAGVCECVFYDSQQPLGYAQFYIHSSLACWPGISLLWPSHSLVLWLMSRIHFFSFLFSLSNSLNIQEPNPTDEPTGNVKSRFHALRQSTWNQNILNGQTRRFANARLKRKTL